MRHFRADAGEEGKPGEGIGNFAGELILEDDGGFFDVLGFTVVEADLPGTKLDKKISTTVMTGTNGNLQP